MTTKFIFFTGGVVSSVGKGVTAATIGRLLKERGYNVAIQKLDPYINVDPGTMSPYQHGEVFVLDDGAETDLDLGHYERFIDIRLNRLCNITTGQVYAEVIKKERRGDYLGGTIQVIPHITNEIKQRIGKVAKSMDAEIVLIEVGGTVGDIESQPFLEAIRQLRFDLGRENTLYIHTTWLPYIGATGELKTKPTQHSVRELRSIGIAPDMIIARTDHPVESSIIEKISLFCDVEKQAVIPMVTAETLYEIPLTMREAGVDTYVLNRLGLESRKEPALAQWEKLVEDIRKPKHNITVALVGKYIELHDAYMSVKEALAHAGFAESTEVDIKWIHSNDLDKGIPDELFKDVDGILVPGGFGTRGTEGKIAAARYARMHKIPYLGLCLGMQLMMVEFGRFVLEDETANSAEFDRNTAHPIIDLMADQRDISDMGGTMRLGLYPCKLKPDSISGRAYQQDLIDERHRHRFEFNNDYRELFEQNGVVFSGVSPDNKLVEIAELKDHPFMVGTQFHPEFLSRPDRPHPLFKGFVQAALAKSQTVSAKGTE
jgi:CTP synthase